MIWQAGRFCLDLAEPRVMGIVNVTPDSFSDGDPQITADRAIATCQRLLDEGADILDLGGESSRPGAQPVSVDTELGRVLPVLEQAVRLGCAVSIDSAKPEVMRAGLDLGADIVNDIGALRAPGALEVVAAHPACGVCLMHMHGMPGSIRSPSESVDVLVDMLAFLRQRTDVARAAGIGLGRIVVDPGIGFAKTPAQNLEILERQDELLQLGVPVLVGWSRKSTLARLAGVSGMPPSQRSDAQRARLDAASVAAMLLAVQRGARVVRVHNVAASVAALAVWKAAGGARPSSRSAIRHPTL